MQQKIPYNALFIIPILILTVLTGHAQESKKGYGELWDKVSELEKDALTKSALSEVQAISEKAKKAGNSAQTIKALLYTSKYAPYPGRGCPVKNRQRLPCGN